MKKLLGILVLGLLFCNVSYAENCPDDMKLEAYDQTLKSYVEELHGGYFVPEESYKFGLEIQEAVKNKDLKKLLSLIKDDLISGPEMSFFDNKTFDEAFPATFRGGVLMNKPECKPVGSGRGFMLGNGQIWYDVVQYQPWDLDKDLMNHKWFSNLSRGEQMQILIQFKKLYGPWTITRITETK
jgi:hypothetical protein